MGAVNGSLSPVYPLRKALDFALNTRLVDVDFAFSRPGRELRSNIG